MEDQLRPKVGVGVMVMKDGKCLMHKRNDAHGAGEYASPGGHLEHLESFEDCARREVAEECGIEIKNIRFLYVTNVTEYAPKHYVHIGLIADWAKGEPKNMEPDKGSDWGWYSLDNLPQPQFKTITKTLEAMKTGRHYFGE